VKRNDGDGSSDNDDDREMASLPTILAAHEMIIKGRCIFPIAAYIVVNEDEEVSWF
jgi:hypothetical protein